jgi:hypothetical protein
MVAEKGNFTPDKRLLHRARVCKGQSGIRTPIERIQKIQNIV